MNSKTFAYFLIAKDEHLDDAILKTLNPLDQWIGHSTCGQFASHPQWWEIRESVRRICEGLAFKPSEFVESEHTFDRFDSVFPDLREKWDVANPCALGVP